MTKELEEFGLKSGEAKTKDQDRVKWRRLIGALRPSRDEKVE